MTKEEILKKHVFKLKNLAGFEIETLEAMQEYSDIQNAALIERVKELEEYCREVCRIIKDEEVLIQDNTDDSQAYWIYEKANNLLTKHK